MQAYGIQTFTGRAISLYMKANCGVAAIGPKFEEGRDHHFEDDSYRCDINLQRNVPSPPHTSIKIIDANSQESHDRIELQHITPTATPTNMLKSPIQKETYTQRKMP